VIQQNHSPNPVKCHYFSSKGSCDTYDGPNYNVRCDGQTHLWEMIKDKVKSGDIKPTIEEVYIITDGEDNQSSPVNWQGIDGSKKLMEYANANGVNLTINFIGIDMDVLRSDPAKARALHETFEKEGGKCVVVDTNKKESIKEQVKTVIDQDPVKILQREVNKHRHSLRQLHANDEEKKRKIHELEEMNQRLQQSQSTSYAEIAMKAPFQIMKVPFAVVAFASSSGIQVINSCENEILSRNFWGICNRRNSQSKDMHALVTEARGFFEMMTRHAMRAEEEMTRLDRERDQRKHDFELKEEYESQRRLQREEMDSLKEEIERLKREKEQNEKEMCCRDSETEELRTRLSVIEKNEEDQKELKSKEEHSRQLEMEALKEKLDNEKHALMEVMQENSIMKKEIENMKRDDVESRTEIDQLHADECVEESSGDEKSKTESFQSCKEAYEKSRKH